MLINTTFMGTLTLDISARGNLPPSSSGWKSIFINYGATHVFTLENFTTETTPPYADPEGDALKAIKITSLPLQGQLLKGIVPVLINDEITSAELVAGDLTYEADLTDPNGYSDGYMEFRVSDQGSSIFRFFSSTVTFVVKGNINLGPRNVGDGEIDITVGSTTVFTRAMLTSELSPQYDDPENDSALNLLIEEVPIYGNLYLNGVLVVEDQVISFADIDLGNLTYVNNSVSNNGDEESFNFRISDSGSGEYTG